MRLKELREKAGMSQTKFAELLHVRQNTVSNWENGNRKIDTDTLVNISNILQVPIDDILGHNRNEKKEPIPPEGDGLDPMTQQLVSLLSRLTPDQKKFLLAQMLTLLQEQG